MPPKALRRPAAKGKALPRPGAGPRRPRIKRPAAAGEADKSFEDFGEVKTSSIPPVTCGRVLFTEVIYWKEATKLVGIIKGLRRENGDLWAEVKVEGTQSEHLLRHLTGVPGRVIRGHLCGEDCSQELASDNVAHLVKAKRMRPEDEVGWMKNLLDSGRDEEDQLDVIRKEAEEARSPSPRRDDTPKERKLKKEAKKDKKKDERRERKRSRTPPALRRGGRDLGVVLGNSGLDPSPQRRRRFLRKAKKMIRKGRKKRQSSSPSGSSKVSSSSSQETSVGAADIFGQSKMAKRIWKKCPGVLTATSLATMQEQLLTAQGQLWDLDKRELPPLFLQFFRGNIGPRMPPAMRREGLHLAFCLDLGIQGRIPELMDAMSQRLKALDGQTNGKHWTVTSQYELVPEETATVATPQETEAAAKEAREAGRLRAQSSRVFGATANPDRTQEWRRESTEKGKGAKGQAKGKDWRQANRDQRDTRRDLPAEKEKERTKGK